MIEKQLFEAAMTQDEQEQQRSIVDVLKRVGPECATYALPALVGLIQHEKNSKLGRQAWRLITTFDPQTLTAYAHVLAPLKDMMSDEG